jgi:malyl-CoA/(S)-citramalyl-CoA lyase
MPPRPRRVTTVIGGPNPKYHVLTDADDAAIAKSIGATCGIMPSPAWSSPPAPNACVRSTDPSVDFLRPDGYTAQANRAATLGCEGKWAIHPSQIDLANEPVQSPSEKEVNQAKRILAAMEQAAQRKARARCRSTAA